ncbi:Long-chain-fatty-acid--CoA ligase FadD13 [Pseudovibrio axinellae]|uniref:Long-chain-fatty-acid--CoA ligase FadD13 n=1 Tax=Pseudovibrio axinellae TaxID=989403 RepID=A0A165Y2X6_9HYPH|nr:AMP-binding protein [Pseudovibrio axinellae]KZL18384.1 Long-chain-fatty-acid--CoA ligase FadD13 [Pseudovibrio axinellae]SER70818.1 Acyl-CoA synthetase (AMP-forming)/AMP-acid ligase II [Pseudovibrio axinellae]
MVASEYSVRSGDLNFDKFVNYLGSVETGKPLMNDLNGRTLTSRQFAMRARQFAGGVTSLGIEKGSRIAILGLNSFEYVEVMVGSILAGMITVPLNIRWSPKEFLYAIDHSQINTIVYDDTFAPMVDGIKENAGSLVNFIHISEGDVGEGVIRYESLLDAPCELELARDVSTECFMSYTGGTTGFPKGVVHTHESMMSCANILATNGCPTLQGTSMVVMPIFHLSGYGPIFARLLQNRPTVIVPMFRPDLVVAAVKKFDVSSFLLAPIMFQMLINAPEFEPKDFENVAQVVYGASPISEALLKLVQKNFPKTDLTQAYGMTEAGAGVYLWPQFHAGELARPGAAGQASSPLLDVRVEDDDGNELPANSIGEVVFYTPSIMSRYYNAPEQTAAAIRNGGYRTGDVGMKDDFGVLFLKDRLKDMIITGAENVYTAEVESAISLHPDVAMVAVIGIPSETYGEAVHAVIVPREGTAPTFEEIRNHAKERIAGYKCPRSISLADELPLSAMNKVLKNKLREKFWENHNREIA